MATKGILAGCPFLLRLIPVTSRTGNGFALGFAAAKQGGACVGKTKRGKGSKIMAIADRQGLPVAVHVESATPHEVRLVHATLAERLSGSSRCVS
jgi:hypothetical protein